MEIEKKQGTEESIPRIKEVQELTSSIPDPDKTFSASPPAEIAKKILQIQGKLRPIVPGGEMHIHGNTVNYISKPQVLNALVPLMAEAGLVCVFGGVHRVDTLDRRIAVIGNPRRQVTFLKERIWSVFHLIDIDSGERYSQMIPADVSGMDSKNATVALAFCERDFLSQVFLVRAKGDSASMEELQSEENFTPLSVARNLDMEGIRETLEIKAKSAIQRVSRHKVDVEARKRGIVIPQRTEEMTSTELLEVLDLCMELMNPSTAQEHLADVGRELKHDSRPA